MSIHSIVEEIYGSMMFEDEECPELVIEMLYDEIVNHHSDLFRSFDKEEIGQAIRSVAKQGVHNKSYSDKLVLRYLIKKIYLDLILQNHDPDDPSFERTLTDIAAENPRIRPHLYVLEDGQLHPRRFSPVHDFLRDVNCGVIDIPIAKPYLNYVPTNRANDILNWHKSLVEPLVPLTTVRINLNEPIEFD